MKARRQGDAIADFVGEGRVGVVIEPAIGFVSGMGIEQRAQTSKLHRTWSREIDETAGIAHRARRVAFGLLRRLRELHFLKQATGIGRGSDGSRWAVFELDINRLQIAIVLRRGWRRAREIGGGWIDDERRAILIRGGKRVVLGSRVNPLRRCAGYIDQDASKGFEAGLRGNDVNGGNRSDERGLCVDALALELRNERGRFGG